MDAIVQERDNFIALHDPADLDLNLLTRVKYKILISLKNHWEGLSVFVDHPEVSMDNNPGEKSIRNPVTGRKNFSTRADGIICTKRPICRHLL